MEIKSITITADASKNYQKFSVSFTAENLQKDDINILKNWAIKEAKDGVNKMSSESPVEEPKVEVKVQEQQPKQETPNTIKPQYVRRNINGFTYFLMDDKKDPNKKYWSAAHEDRLKGAKAWLPYEG